MSTKNLHRTRKRFSLPGLLTKSVFMTLFVLFSFGSNAQGLEKTVADGSSTNQYVPIYGYYMDFYCRSQFIYPADSLSDIVGSKISSVVFYTSTTTQSYTSTMTVGLLVTNTNNFSSDTWADTTGITEVYNGTLSISNGTMTIDFDEPFQYEGGNLMISFLSLSKGNYLRAYFYGSYLQYASAYGRGPSAENIYSYSQDFLPKTTFNLVDDATCSTPRELNASYIGSNNARIDWSNAGNGTAISYSIAYRRATQANYEYKHNITELYDTLSNLTPRTDYIYKVQRICEGSDTSAWSSTKTFKTLAACDAVTNLAVSPEALSATLTWTSDAPSFNVKCSSHEINPDTEIGDILNNVYGNITDTTITIENLEPNTYYYFYVQARCESNSLSDWASRYDNTEIYCVAPTNFTVDSINTTTAYLSWHQDGNVCSNWEISYYEPAISEFIYLTFTDTTAIINNLTPEKGYYFYIHAICGNYKSYDASTYGTTLTACEAISNLATSDITESSIKLSWTPNGEANSWIIRYSNDYFTTYDSVIVNDTIYTIENLQGSTYYEFTVVSDCGNFQSSEQRIGASIPCPAFVVTEDTPFFEGFEENHSDDNPVENCWEQTTTYNYWLAINNGYSYQAPHSGEWAASLMYSYYDNVATISRALNLQNGTNYHFELFTHQQDYEYGDDQKSLTAEIISIEGETIFTTTIDPVEDNGSSSWTKMSGYFTVPTDGNYTLSITGDYGNNRYLVIDDISVSVAPSCPAPSNLSISNETATGLDLSWTPDGDETSWNYIVSENVISDFENANILTANNDTITINDLTAGEYSFYVQANCGNNDYSSWIKLENISFNGNSPLNLTANLTEFGPKLNWNTNSINPAPIVSIDTIYTENFDASSTIPASLSLVYGDGVGSVNPMIISSDESYSGNNSFSFSSYEQADDYYQYLILPEIDPSKTTELSFRYLSDHSTDYITVGYSSTGNNIEDFTFETNTSNTSWTEYKITFPANTKYAAIRYYGYYQYYAYVDDIMLTNENPTGIYYKVNRDGVEIADSVEALTYLDTIDVSTLNEESTHCYTVSQILDNGTSDLSNEACITMYPEKAPLNLIATSVESEVYLNWEAPSYSFIDDYYYRLYRDGVLIEDSITTTSAIDDDLSPAEYCYTVKVISNEIEYAPSNTACVTTTAETPCTEPENLTILANPWWSGIDYHISWDAVENAIRYNIYADSVYQYSTTNTAANLTLYESSEIQVTALFNNLCGESEMSSILAPVKFNTTLYIDSVTATSMYLRWNNNNVNSWKVRCTSDYENYFESAPITDTTFVIENLTPNTDYEISLISQDEYIVTGYIAYSYERTLNNEAEILSFAFTNGQTEAATLNSEYGLINIPASEDMAGTLIPIIEISEHASINPSSLTEQDFSSTVVYTVTAEDGTTKEWRTGINNHLVWGEEANLSGCDSVEWNNTIYYANEYVSTIISVSATQDSIALANIVVNYSSVTEIYDTTDVVYAWFGQDLSESGTYYHSLTNEFGCDSTIILHLYSTVGINNYESQSLNIFPNPTNNVLNITMNGTLGNIRVYDIVGREVYSVKVDENSYILPVQNYNAGTYFIRIENTNGVTTKKFIKE